MIFLLHGDNQLASRQKLIELIEKARLEKKEIIELDGLKITLNQLIQALESSSLFGQEKLVIIENLFTRPQSHDKDKIVFYLKKEPIVPDLIFWEKKEIPGTTLRWLPKNWQIKSFKTPAIIFSFLSSLKPENTQRMLTLLHQCLKKETPEMIFYMLVRQIRLLILAKDLGKEGVSGAPWQIGKILNQANQFNLEELINIDKHLLEIDIDIKTGRSFMPLDWHLDLLIANL